MMPWIPTSYQTKMSKKKAYQRILSLVMKPVIVYYLNSDIIILIFVALHLQFASVRMKVKSSGNSSIKKKNFFKIYLFYLFIFGCVGSSLLHVGFL